MIKHRCMVTHKPHEGKYGDCLRACVASILEIDDIHSVPNWADPTVSTDWFIDCRAWCLTRGMAAVLLEFPREWSMTEVMEFMSECDALYMLVGNTTEHPHCAIYRNDQFVHDPAWFPSPIIGPPTEGNWQIILIAKA